MRARTLRARENACETGILGENSSFGETTVENNLFGEKQYGRMRVWAITNFWAYASMGDKKLSETSIGVTKRTFQAF